MHKARLDELVDDYVDGTLDKVSYQRATDRLKTKVDEANKRIQQCLPHQLNIAIPSNRLHEAWDSETTDWRRSLLGLLVSRIVVHPGTAKPWYELDGGERCRFAPQLVEIEWLV
jgi:hypothetical protein